MTHLPQHRNRHARQQGGYVLLLTLITLLVLLFGVLFTMRGTLLQTVMTGNTLQRQKDVQASDLSLRLVQQQILSNSKASGYTPLDSLPTTATQPWFFQPGGTAPWPQPGDASGTNADYWSTCSATSTTEPCWTIPGMPSGYTAQAIVVPTNLPTGSCPSTTTPYANFYDIFIHTAEAHGSTAVTTETVFRLCTSK